MQNADHNSEPVHIDLEDEAGHNAETNEGAVKLNEADWSKFDEPMQTVYPTQESVNYVLVPDPMQRVYSQQVENTEDDFCYANTHVEEDHVEVESDQEGDFNMEEENEGDAASDESTDSEYNPENEELEQTKEDLELKEIIAEMNREEDDPLLHCEGDTDVENIFELIQKKR